MEGGERRLHARGPGHRPAMPQHGPRCPGRSRYRAADAIFGRRSRLPRQDHGEAERAAGMMLMRPLPVRSRRRPMPAMTSEQDNLQPSRDLAVLLAVMKRLREGCPWDQVQTFDTIAPYTIEEAYEVASAIADKDMKSLPGELGDLLFQVVFHARMAEEAGLFDFGDVVEAVTAKMIRRHPHVFGDAEAKISAEDQKAYWESLKVDERKAKAQHGVLDDVPSALPALVRAEKLQKRASSVGFDWNNAQHVLGKIAEEAREVVE